MAATAGFAMSVHRCLAINACALHFADPIASLFYAACFHDTICDPFRNRMRYGAKSQKLSSVAPHNQLTIDQTKRDRRNDEQIDRGDAVGMIGVPIGSTQENR